MPKMNKFKCSKCDRTFSMAAHLARHQNTLHGAKTRKTGARKTAVRRPRRGRARAAARRPAASGPVGVLREMLAYRQSLLSQRAQLDSKIGAMDQALAALGTAAPPAARRARGRRRKGAARAGSLKDYIGRVLRAGKGRPMAVKDVAAGVLKAGYRTKNKTLAKSVGIALSQLPDVTRVSRGVFKLR